MMPLALAFYITVSTEPIQPAENKYSCGASIVLIGVPSRKLAERWADDFARKSFLDRQHDQKIKEIRIVPLSNSLLSMTGREEIDWSRLREQVQIVAKDPRHEFELFSGGGIVLPSTTDTSVLPKDWDNPKTLRAQVPKEHRDKMNWNDSHPAFFIYHDATKAIIVRGSNSISASIPFIKDTGKDKPTGPQIFMECVAWIEEYR